MTRLGAIGLAILILPGLGSALAWHAYAASGAPGWRLVASAGAGGALGGLVALGRLVLRRCRG